MPSLWEGRSILQLEALVLDKPMIISDVPGLRETFNEHKLNPNETMRRCKWGYLVETNNVEAYKEAIISFKENREPFSSDNMEKIYSSYDIADVAKAYIYEYINL